MKCVWVAVALAMIVFQPFSVGKLFGQRPDPSASDRTDQAMAERPFRRIFVLDSQLPNLPVDNLRPLEIDRLPGALDRLIRRNSESIDPWNSSAQNLRSFHAVAQLVGAELLSERTHLIWSKPLKTLSKIQSETTARERLTPWNLAIENSFDELNNSQSPTNPRGPSESSSEKKGESDANASPTWVFDSTGNPLLQRIGDEAWIRWSLRPTSDSTPNRLNYEALVPRTVDGCLVLLLPKSARVEQSNVVIRKFESWEEVADRMGGWPERKPNLGTSLSTTLENAYWVLEISGNEKISFSIELGSNPGSGQAIQMPTEWGIDRLFSKQTLQYSIHANQLRVLGEWEWNETGGSNQPLRLELPQGMKLRSLAINDRESNLSLNGNRVVVSIPETLGLNLGGSTRMRMTAEFLIPWAELPLDASGNAILPAIRNSNGAVLFGTTILQDQIDGRFVGVAPDRGGLELVRRATEGLHRLEYSWNRNAPDFHCNLEKQAANHQIESIVRINTDADRCIANVRLRLFRLNGRGIQDINIPAGWQMDPKSIACKPQANLDFVTLEDSLTAIRIDTNKLLGSETTLDFQVAMNLDSGGELQLGQMPWLSMNDTTIRHCLYVEPNASNRLSFRGRTSQWVLSDEDLTPWQRDSLPRLGRALIFGTHDNQLPPLVATSLEDSLVIPIETTVRRSDAQWRVEHRFLLSSEWSDISQVRVRLPEGFQWHYEGSQRLPITTQFDSDSGAWTIQLSNLSLDSEPDSLRALVATKSTYSTLPTFEMIEPLVAEAKRISYRLNLSEQLIIARPDGMQVNPKSDGSAFVYSYESIVGPQNAPSEDGPRPLRTIEILDTNHYQISTPFFFDSRLDLFVDGFGNQTAELLTKLVVPSSSEGELTVELPQGWTVADSYLISGERKVPLLLLKSTSISTKSVVGVQLGFGGQLGFVGLNARPDTTLHVRLVGPKADEVNDTSGWMNQLLGLQAHSRKLQFRFPEVRFAQIDSFLPIQRVWFPEGLKLSLLDAGAPSLERESWWPVWEWTKSTLKLLLPLATDQRPQASPRGPPGRWSSMVLNPKRAGEGCELLLTKPAVERYSSWLMVFAAFFSAGCFRRWPWFVMFVAVGCWIGSFWFVADFSIWCQQVFVGLACGGILYRLYQIIRPATMISSQSIRSDRSSTWDPKGESKGIGPTMVLPLFFFPIGLVSLVLAHSGHGYSQDPLDETAKVFDILIPITDQGELYGTTIYVPDELFKLIEQEDRERRQRDSVALFGSSKHYLRLDSRSLGFGNADQPLTSNYEIWISEAAVGRAVRIPFPAESLKLSRFSIDGVEVLSGRFSKSDTELVWFPDRPGRRSVQIESQVRLRSIDGLPNGIPLGTFLSSNNVSSGGGIAGEKNPNKAWAIDTEVMPVGNAVLEIETDGAWSVNVSAFGRSSNPSMGRSVVQLGNKNRVEGFFQPPLSTGNRSPLLAMPSDPSPSGPDVPTMNTELFLDSDQLMARTVIEYPGVSAMAGDIEIEADSQWLPIGIHWGDATLFDVRTGSTLDRRRYAVRLNPMNLEEQPTGGQANAKRSIVTTWVPVGDASLRSILFAECRDRRVRQGVFRYARSPGSLWTLDGISSWIPAINAKERLDWPDLKEPPLTTNLRIPLSSGFGVLRRQTLPKTQQLFATHKIHLASDRARVMTTIKLNSPFGNKTQLTFEIPNGYRVDRVLNQSGSLEFLSWVKESKSFLQILIDRQVESVSEFVVEYSLPLSIAHSSAFEFVLPELKATVGWASPPTFLLSADPTWTLDVEKSDLTNNWGIQGGGPERLLVQGSMEQLDRNPIALKRCPSDWSGVLVVRIPEESSGAGLQIYGLRPDASNEPWHGIELSIPRESMASWSSKNPTQEYTDLRWNHRIISIDPLVSNPEDPTRRPYDFLIDLAPELGVAVDLKAVEQIEINGRKPKDVLIAIPKSNGLAMRVSQLLGTSGSVDSLIRKTLGFNDDQWLLGTLSRQPDIQHKGDPKLADGYQQFFARHQRKANGSIQSEFWLQRQPGLSSQGSLQWIVPVDWKCGLALVNGQYYPFRQDGSNLEVYYPPMDTIAQVELRFASVTRVSSSLESDQPPYLASSSSKGSVVSLLNSTSLRDQQASVQIEFDAWTSTLQNNLNKDDGSQAWRYCAGRFAEMLWAAASASHPSFGSLSSEDFEAGVQTLSEMPWTSPADYRHVLDSSIRSDPHDGDTDLNTLPKEHTSPIAGSGSFKSVTSELMVQCFLPLLVFISLAWLWRRNQGWLHHRTWWQLLSLALAWWLLTGDLLLPSLAALLAAVLAMDTYWMITAQFRQTGIRVPR